MFDFTIAPNGPLSQRALAKDLHTFQQLSSYLLQLPYRRPQAKTALAVFDENCGTCSSKHGLLKAIALENNRAEIQLMRCLFLMNGINTPQLAPLFANNALQQVPEAHCYLNTPDGPLDITKPGVHIKMLTQDVIVTEEIDLLQLSQKQAWHQQQLQRWLKQQGASIDFNEAWSLREACIAELSTDQF